MQLVAILGSPRGMKGNTGRLLRAVLEAAEAEGATVRPFLLADLTVEPCRACDVCHKKGRCVIEDHWPTIREALPQADAVVLASPNYIFSVSAQMKALLDRSSSLIHCLALEGKYGAAVVTSGGSGAQEVEAYLLRCLRSWGCWTVGSVGTEAWRLTEPATAEPILEAARSLGRRLVQAAGQRQTFPEQVPEREAFYARMKDLVVRMKEAWPFEYAYWKSRGRL